MSQWACSVECGLGRSWLHAQWHGKLRDWGVCLTNEKLKSRESYQLQRELGDYPSGMWGVGIAHRERNSGFRIFSSELRISLLFVLAYNLFANCLCIAWNRSHEVYCRNSFELAHCCSSSWKSEANGRATQGLVV
jgi:hypothetical protein